MHSRQTHTECIQNNINIICLPGPTACISALVQSGLPSDKFNFEGFIPVKKGRKKVLSDIATRKSTTIIYESPHRILKTLKELNEIINNRNIVVLKELTKIHESVFRGTISDVINAISKSKIKNGIAYCFGIHDDISFETKLSDLLNFKVIMYDPSPISIKKYSNINLKHNNITFFPYALSTEDKKMKFFYQKDNYN